MQKCFRLTDPNPAVPLNQVPPQPCLAPWEASTLPRYQAGLLRPSSSTQQASKQFLQCLITESTNNTNK